MPIRPNKRFDSIAIWLPGATGQLLPSNPVHIHIAPSLHSLLSLNGAWHASGCAYQITAHSSAKVLRVSYIIRHVFKHSAPPAHINMHSLTPDNWEGYTRRLTREGVFVSVEMEGCFVFLWQSLYGRDMWVIFYNLSGGGGMIKQNSDEAGYGKKKARMYFFLVVRHMASVTPISCLSI